MGAREVYVEQVRDPRWELSWQPAVHKHRDPQQEGQVADSSLKASERQVQKGRGPSSY